jgi:hypothetical protein
LLVGSIFELSNTLTAKAVLDIPNITQRIDKPESSTAGAPFSLDAEQPQQPQGSKIPPLEIPKLSSDLRDAEQIAIKAKIDEQSLDILDASDYDIEDFALNVSPNSKLCPAFECDFSLDNGIMRVNRFTLPNYDYQLDGVLTVSVEEDGSTRSVEYDLGGEIERIETVQQQNGDTIISLKGEIQIGDNEYNIWKGSIEFEDDEDEGILILQGEKG